MTPDSEATSSPVNKLVVRNIGLLLSGDLDQPILDLHQTQLGHLGEKRLGTLLKLLERVRDGK